MAKFTVMMLGPEAVGKTSLLATMYRELAGMDNQAQFNFFAKGDTGVDLEDAFQKLSRIIAQPIFEDIGHLLPGTAGIISHNFEISFRGKKKVEVEFCDIAGGLVWAKANNPAFPIFKSKLDTASVIINVIDGAVLMEGSQIFSDTHNAPMLIRDHLLPVLGDKEPHLILFVISKCEKWLNNEPDKNKLLKRFDERFKPVINLIEEHNNAVGVVIPVKTLGCVEFSRMEKKENGEERAIFVRRPGKNFKPEFTDQPLRYALAFVLSEAHKKRPWWMKLFNFSSDPAFRESLLQFARERDTTCKNYGNFQLIRITG